MSSIRNTKNRIKSVQTTAKVTKAMKSIAAMRLRRYTQKTVQLDRYVHQLYNSLASALSSLPIDSLPNVLKGNPSGKILLVLIAPSRGFCGGLHRTAVGDCVKQLQAQGVDIADANQIELILVNRPAKRAISRTGGYVLAAFDGPYKEIDTYTALPISELVRSLWATGNYKSLMISFAKSNAAFRSTVNLEQILPLQAKDLKTDNTPANVDGEISDLVDEMLPLLLQAEVHYGLLATQAAEEGARMVAMNQATDNAKELEKKLNLIYFRQRQAKITQEIAEIVGGSL
jgi:F-type H+-transporting ATPase subunit gamma